MSEASAVAAEAIRSAVETWTESGLSRAFNAVTTSTWATNLERHEEELGDDATTLGTLCARNLANRVHAHVSAVRAAEHGGTQTDFAPAGVADRRNEWAVDGLRVDRPRGSLRLTLGGRHFYVMKAPMASGRQPDWSSFVKWDAESDTRREIAESNFKVLGDFYNPGPGQGELWSHLTSSPASAIREFLVVWGGEPNQPRTAGWLTVPGIGETPFIARSGLWWDASEGNTGPSGGRRTPTGPSFDDKPSTTPSVTLRPSREDAGRG